PASGPRRTSRTAPSASRNGRKPPASMCAAFSPRRRAAMSQKSAGCRPASTSPAARGRCRGSSPPASASWRGRAPASSPSSRPDARLSAMLASGEVDAVISARAPAGFARGGPVVRLYPNYRAEEERFFRKTGIFPIMHLMTMRRTVFEQHPWIAMNLFKMFDEAKRRCFNRLRDFTCARIPLAWAAAIADEITAGDGPDPYPYGIEESRPTIEAFCRYAHDQGVTHRRMTVDDLFPREVRTTARV